MSEQNESTGFGKLREALLAHPKSVFETDGILPSGNACFIRVGLLGEKVITKVDFAQKPTEEDEALVREFVDYALGCPAEFEARGAEEFTRKMMKSMGGGLG